MIPISDPAAVVTITNRHGFTYYMRPGSLEVQGAYVAFDWQRNRKDPEHYQRVMLLRDQIAAVVSEARNAA